MSDENEALRLKWDARYRDEDVAQAWHCHVLDAFPHLLPARGLALDVACGLGGNALFLARRGLRVDAWDISPVAIGKLMTFVADSDLPVRARVRDVCVQPPPPSSFDVIVVAHFLDRPLAPRLIDALRPQGLLFYQTFTDARVDDSGPPARYRLADNELRELFSALRLLAYREEARVGDLAAGWRNEALLVGQKTS